VADSSGDAAEKIAYDPYGEATVTVQGGHCATANPYLFQGRRWDSEVDLYYYRNRVMSPTLGRFLQRDPLVDRMQLPLGSAENYGFAERRSYVLSDPQGPLVQMLWGGLNGSSVLSVRAGDVPLLRGPKTALADRDRPPFHGALMGDN